MKRIAIQGIEGSYHEIAARDYAALHYADEEIEVLPRRSFRDVLDTVLKQPEMQGMLAIENTIAGSLLPNHALIREAVRGGLTVLGEYRLRISHCLAALPGTRHDDIEEIASHPMALAQCEKFLETYPFLRVVEKDDTASSAQWIALNRLENHAAICSRRAAEIYGLDILAHGIETDKHNFTRFLLIGPPEPVSAPTLNKASLVFSLSHEVGSLSKVLAILSFYEMNLTKIQSLPMVGAEWEYRFYIDLSFDDIVRYENAVAAVRPLVTELDVLGVYAESSATTARSSRDCEHSSQLAGLQLAK